MNREDLIYKTFRHFYNFQQLQTIRYFTKNIFNGQNTLNDANKDQANLLVEIMNFNKSVNQESQEKWINVNFSCL